jgi:UDP-N-acetylglucosamine 2-epimerase
MKKLFIVVGARPNFIKVAPVIKALNGKFDYKIIHTGQHYDTYMSDIFFEDLNIPKPDINFNIHSKYHGQQIAKIIGMFEILCLKEKPDYVIVVGDINSTLACALVVSKMQNIKLVHIESGERSYDKTMPEEINRILTDHVSDILFCTNELAAYGLERENIEKSKIHIVGNTMIDNLIEYLPKIRDKNININENFILATIHRASNTDDVDKLKDILLAFNQISKKITVVFPIHPRTQNRIEEFKLHKYLENIKTCNPLSYLDFMSYVYNSKAVVTDSGGLQIESAYLNIPCITLRDNTEHTITLIRGVNTLVGTNKNEIIETVFHKINNSKCIYYDELADGKASQRIVNTIYND